MVDSTNKFTKVLARTTGEVRYKPTLSSIDAVLESGKRLEDNFPHWRIQDDRRAVDLIDDDKKTQMSIRYNGLFYLNEGKDSTKGLLDLVTSIYDSVFETTGVKEIRHIGCRRKYIMESKFDFQDLVDLTFKKFYGNLNALRLLSAETVRDTVFVLEGIKDDMHTRVQIGPAKSKQAQDFFEQQFKSDYLFSDAKSYLLLDVDVFAKSDVSINKSVALLRKADEMNLDILNSYIEFLLAP